MAERYSRLPTEVLRDATTVDLIIFDVALSYRNHQQRKASAKREGTTMQPEVSPEQMAEMWERVKK